ncbi:MAG: TetR/AcrR family transcriptional regulator [Candidatus Solibacter usitatus]|nr:TetR/AcrR family transcriptional regulator [Candidatus Solibacter usitatus]
MGVKERRERHREGLRKVILDAARDLFVNEGYQNVSMRRIAQKIEYSPTTIYLHFKDKGDLLYQLCEETFRGLYAALRNFSVQESAADPLDLLRQGLRCYVEFGLQNPNQYRVTFMMGYSIDDPEGRSLDPANPGMRAFAILREGVEACIRQGKFRQADVEATSQALWAAIHGITSLLIANSRFPWVDKEKLVDLVIDTMLAGLRA